MNNCDSNIIVVVEGVKMTLAEAARKYKRPYKTVLTRVRRHNWSIEKALELN